MPGKTKRGPSNTSYYKNYEIQDKWEKNKVKKIEKRLAEHPNDVQSIKRKVPDYGPSWAKKKKRE